MKRTLILAAACLPLLGGRAEAEDPFAAGQDALAEAVKRYRLLEQNELNQERNPKPSKA